MSSDESMVELLDVALLLLPLLLLPVVAVAPTTGVVPSCSKRQFMMSPSPSLRTPLLPLNSNEPLDSTR
jgi:hypothetical protein